MCGIAGLIYRDGRGQHTTTARRLLRLPSGALWLDTPGMREFGLWEDGGGVDEVFDEVTELAGRCRFTDCGHDGEPGCAVTAALEDGRIDTQRVAAWRKLQREMAFLRAKQDSRVRLEQRHAARRFTKSVRSQTQARKRRRG